MKRTKIIAELDEQPEAEEQKERVEPFTDEEIIQIRYEVLGKCPNCGNFVRGWSPGAFSADRYRAWQDAGIDAISGHRVECPTKWKR